MDTSQTGKAVLIAGMAIGAVVGKATANDMVAGAIVGSTVAGAARLVNVMVANSNLIDAYGEPRVANETSAPSEVPMDLVPLSIPIIGAYALATGDRVFAAVSAMSFGLNVAVSSFEAKVDSASRRLRATPQTQQAPST